MSVSTKVVDTLVLQIIRYAAQLVYFTGLTALIPLLPLFLHPTEVVNARAAFEFAIIMIFFSFALVLFVTRSKKKALLSLGLMTLFPGMLAVLFAYVGERRLVIFLSQFGKATPLVQNYINTYVPKTWFLAGIYIMLGCALVWLSEQLRK